ncbi:hypothetical protein B0H63DRAFT_117285 [Podospora didyma]|uniref:Protein kinase domain-containing protein n=1 Tax=Podospora didyma TaxID=330526 RepID=A0AAE0U4H7_9PEZI|nr:hypothetical protein B0H63DRAFT_117285 [Podospora didyma]
MAQPQLDAPARDTVSTADSNGHLQQSIWRRMFFGRDKDNRGSATDPTSKGQGADQQDDKAGLIRRVSRKVVPGLPRAQTFKRQQSELRNKLEPVQPTPAERRAVSMDRRIHASKSASISNPRTSAPDFMRRSISTAPSVPAIPTSPYDEAMRDDIEHSNGHQTVPEKQPADAANFGLVQDLEQEQEHEREHEQEQEQEQEQEREQEHGHENRLGHVADAVSTGDAHSMTTSQYDLLIHDELERIWILNLSMHFRDKSKREKFFVTYREHSTLWRRVTVSIDYRDAQENSLEMDLVQTKFQREKSAKIYEAIRESLVDIQFYDTVTNLKLQTTDGRLHVHVVEDTNEIINYPTVRMVQHMRCRRVKEREIEFESHMSGFVYKVRINGETLIKKEIPGPDTVDEFLYEINALNRLRSAQNVIEFYGVIVDDNEENVKGLLISYAERGALIDVIFDHDHGLPWQTREKWARQIVGGLSEIHEAGFVQGDFTLSNIVIDDNGDAKIIDINRRGCPVGWEPPEATPLIESNQHISMYIGVKSDLYQLGMVLWALATQDDEPEQHGRPLTIPTELHVPDWYRHIVETCLSEDPRYRVQALRLLPLFPDPEEESQYDGHPDAPSVSIDDNYSRQDYLDESFTSTGVPEIRTVQPPNSWSYVGWSNPYLSPAVADDPYYYPARGRSPPSPIPSNHDGCEPSRYGHIRPSWSDSHNQGYDAPSVSDITHSEYEVESRVDFTSKEEIPQVTEIALGEHGERLADSSEPDGSDGISPGTQQHPAEASHPGGNETAGPTIYNHEDGDPSAPQEPLEFSDVAMTPRRVDTEAVNDEGLLSGLTKTGKTEPDSPADSGKDVMESTEGRHRASSSESRGEYVLGSGDICGNNRYLPEALVRAPQELSERASEPRSDPTTKNEPGPSLIAQAPSLPGSPTITPSLTLGFALPDDLKGIGSAYDLSSEGRHDLIPEDDFVIELSTAGDDTH